MCGRWCWSVHTLLQLQCHWLKITFKRTTLALAPTRAMAFGSWQLEWFATIKENSAWKKAIYFHRNFAYSRHFLSFERTHIHRRGRAHTPTRYAMDILYTTCFLWHYISRKFILFHSVATRSRAGLVRFTTTFLVFSVFVQNYTSPWFTTKSPRVTVCVSVCVCDL